jgi:hypothetical protein
MKKEGFQNTPNFPLDMSNKQRQLKSNQKSSSIKLTWARRFVTNSLRFKHIVMVNCNASDNSQWLLN